MSEIIEGTEEKKYDDIVQSELYNSIKRGNKLSAIEFYLCERDLKHMYLSAKNDIGILEFKSCDDDLKRINITNLVEAGRTISTAKFDDCNKELRNFYLNQIIPNKDFAIDFDQFLEASDSQKIEYLIYRGLDKAGYKYKDWYEKWRKIKRRDLRIDEILSD
jgi:hypothetical protein